MPDGLTYPQLITAAIAIVAAVISFVSLRRTSEVQRQQLRLQKKQEELTDLQLEALRKQAGAPQTSPQEKADIRVDFVREGKGHKFMITNWGRVPARNVNFQIVAKEGRSSPFVKGDYDRKIPIRELAPGARCPVIAALSFGTGTVFDARWTWQNPDGSEEQRSSLLAV